MKKTLFLLCSIAFMVSCSNDTETTNTTQNQESVNTTAARPLPPVEDSIDAMFHTYVTSTAFINLQTKIETFNIKAKFPQGIEFGSRAQLVLWLEANISSTDFATVSEAVQDWDEIVSLQGAEPLQFPGIYDFFVNAPEELAVAKIEKWLNAKELPLNTTAKDCEKSFRMCTNNANFRYFNLSRSFSQDDQIMAEGKRQHDDALETCRKSYIGCINN